MENFFVYFFWPKNPSEFLVKQWVKSNEQRAKNNGQRAKSNEQQAKSNEKRAKSNKQRAKSNEQQAKSNKQRAKSTKQRAKSNEQWSQTYEQRATSKSFTLCAPFKKKHTRGNNMPFMNKALTNAHKNRTLIRKHY